MARYYVEYAQELNVRYNHTSKQLEKCLPYYSAICGTDGISNIDGRLSVQNANKIAITLCTGKRGAYRIAKGDRLNCLDRVTNCVWNVPSLMDWH